MPAACLPASNTLSTRPSCTRARTICLAAFPRCLCLGLLPGRMPPRTGPLTQVAAVPVTVCVRVRTNQDLRKKLLAAMRRAEAADATLIKMEGEREETRAVENAFKMKMKTLYEKRVRELESMQQDFEQVLSGPFLLPCLICWWRQRGFWKPFGTTVFVG